MDCLDALAWVFETHVARLVAPAMLITTRWRLELRRILIARAAAVAEVAIFWPMLWIAQ
eukprot:SAG31_NODE_32032_length_361_cov_0.583969_1_plen_58_part_10